ncbi:MaoC/PaaZ C-terminal domain-containing protein [Bacillus massiliigorillae]|uniref:MaoC/PaaZ C-terminal domain-containing protein n=1 Tax=Bacillus massiliigorillae TaxID=1243664 RepID=UPI00039B2286|nr:MaoC/PaaZ C-terminal domain-containing protein [Bacillus massiliigorillae]
MSYTIEQLCVGQRACLRRVFSNEDVVLCNQITNDYNEVYQADEDGWKQHFKHPIVPGLLTEGLVNQVISDRLPGNACILLQKELVFYHPVHIGDNITAELEIIDINKERHWVTMKVHCMNQDEQEVIKGQVVIFILPN